MIRALLLNLLGGTFEVRLISLKSGKNIPGTLVCEGGYFKCRKKARDKHLKDGQMIRLQHVAVLDHRINDIDAFVAANQARDVLDFTTTAPPAGMEHVQVAPGITEGRRIVPEQGVMEQPELPADIGKPVYNREPSGDISISKPQDPDAFEPYTGTDPDDHDCDTLGPQDWSVDDSAYHLTCSICGAMR